MAKQLYLLETRNLINPASRGCSNSPSLRLLDFCLRGGRGRLWWGWLEEIGGRMRQAVESVVGDLERPFLHDCVQRGSGVRAGDEREGRAGGDGFIFGGGRLGLRGFLVRWRRGFTGLGRSGFCL